MKKLLAILWVILAACPAVSLHASVECGNPASTEMLAPQSVGLVLSGGGAKGIAHIGVIQALEDNDIPIDYISGTSMGAIVGGLYACGYTPSEMLELIKSRSFSYWSTGVIDPKLTYYFLQDEPLPEMLTLNLGDSTLLQSVLPSSLINPIPMNFAFMELFAPYTAQCGGDFNKLFVPLRTVCSDMTHKRMVVNSQGSLGDAVRASMSFPLVFHPIERDGAVLYDGGIYDNFPVDVMRDNFAPQIMIGVDVSAADEVTSGSNLMAQLEGMIIQRNDYNLPADEGIKMRIHLSDFALLDFAKAQEIYQIGYNKAVEMMDSIKTRVVSRIPAEARRLRRAVFKSQTPGLVFDSVSVSGGNHRQNEYVRQLFDGGREGTTFGLRHARDAFYRAVTPGKFRNLEPAANYSDSTGLFNLNLKASLKKNLFISAGGYLTTASNSTLFLSGAYKTLSFNSLDMRFNAWVGQSYIAAEASAHIRLLRRVPSGLQIRLVAARQKYFRRDKMFYQTSEPTALIESDYFGRLEYGVALGRRGKGGLSLGYGRVEASAGNLANLFPWLSGRWLMRRNMAEARVSAEYCTLNSLSIPTSGAKVSAVVTGASGQLQTYLNAHTESSVYRRYHRSWVQMEVDAEKYWTFGNKVSVGTRVNALLSSKKLLKDYAAAVVDATGFVASATQTNIFTPEFRANSFVAASLVPVVKLSDVIQVRLLGTVFIPVRPIVRDSDGNATYGDAFSRPAFFGGVEGVAKLPFANITAYTHYAGHHQGRWNFGISFGWMIQAPRFLR